MRPSASARYADGLSKTRSRRGIEYRHSRVTRAVGSAVTALGISWRSFLDSLIPGQSKHGRYIYTAHLDMRIYIYMSLGKNRCQRKPNCALLPIDPASWEQSRSFRFRDYKTGSGCVQTFIRKGREPRHRAEIAFIFLTYRLRAKHRGALDHACTC